MSNIKPLFSRNKVNQAGSILRDETSTVPKKEWANNVLSNWRASHAYPVNTFQKNLRDRLKIIDSNAIVAQRLKRTTSIVNKLNKLNSMKLARMQDIGGLRAVVNDLKKVYKLKENYHNSKRMLHELIDVNNYIEEPKSSGYRSIHLIYKYKNNRAADYDGLRIEIQLRTRKQHIWATSVETMGTFLQQALKSSEGSADWLDFFALASSAFALDEGCSPLQSHNNMNEQDVLIKVVEQAKQLDVVTKLKAFSVTTNSVTTQAKSDKKGQYHIIFLDSENKKVIRMSYGRKRLLEATEEYTKIEERIKSNQYSQVVLVKTQTIDALRQAYPNYFLDTHEFIKILERFNRKVRRL